MNRESWLMSQSCIQVIQVRIWVDVIWPVESLSGLIGWGKIYNMAYYHFFFVMNSIEELF